MTNWAKIALSAVAAAILPMAAAHAAEPVLGGYALSYADADFANAPAATTQSIFSADGAQISSTADQGAGARTSSKSQSGAWLNKLDITSNANDPRSIVIGSGLSFFAVNQKLTGAAGSTPFISYTFGIDGVFTPGNNAHYPPAGFAPAQNLTFYLLAYSGRALSNTVVTDSSGTYVSFLSTNGITTLGRGAGGSDANAPFLIAGATACFGADLRCSQGGVFNDSRTVGFNIGVDQDYFLVGYLASNTNGNSDFFNTAKLQTIALAPQFGLVSEDGGALLRGVDGSFRLAVPEPASWMMMIIGFGIIGGAMRRQSAQPVPGLSRR
jgi:hypothetical protein